MPKRLPNTNTDTSRILGFKVGQEVRFNKHYFANHGLKIIDVGIGKVVNKITSKTSTPKIVVQFTYHPSFREEPLCKMLANSEVNKWKILALLEIYPGYLEKVK